MKSLLLLGVVFFGAEAGSQEIQKLLAFARGLELEKVEHGDHMGTWTILNMSVTRFTST